jgi:hypothetical protein
MSHRLTLRYVLDQIHSIPHSILTQAILNGHFSVVEHLMNEECVFIDEKGRLYAKTNVSEAVVMDLLQSKNDTAIFYALDHLPITYRLVNNMLHSDVDIKYLLTLQWDVRNVIAKAFACRSIKDCNELLNTYGREFLVDSILYSDNLNFLMQCKPTISEVRDIYDRSLCCDIVEYLQEKFTFVDKLKKLAHCVGESEKLLTIVFKDPSITCKDLMDTFNEVYFGDASPGLDEQELERYLKHDCLRQAILSKADAALIKID